MELTSLLLIGWLYQGQWMEEALPAMPDAACQLAAASITSAITTDDGPTVTLTNGATVPVLSATCHRACPDDGDLLRLLEG